MNSKLILLIEDNPSDRDLTKRAIERSCITNDLVVMEDGREAVEFLFGSDSQPKATQDHLPRLILLDLKIPKVDGFEILRRIRFSELTKNLPVVILTSSGEESDLTRSYNLGANGFFRKPVNFQEFALAIKNLCHFWLSQSEPSKESLI